MARVSLATATKPAETQKYFASEYGLNKICGKGEVNKEIVLIPLGLEQGVYRTAVHKVRAKGDKDGFKSWYDTNIICKTYNALTGEKEEEECLCCQLAKAEKEKYPTKEESSKRLISRTSSIVHVPVMILGVGDLGKYNGKVPNELLNLDTPLFSYLELAGSTFEKDVVGELRKQLESDGKITYEMTEEEALDKVNKYLLHTLIRIKFVASKSYKYERSYSFVPFYNKSIGAKSGQYARIVKYREDTELMNEVNKFLTLFDSNQEKLVTDWTESELTDYLVNSVARKENIQTAIKVDAEQHKAQTLPKSQQVVEDIEDFEEDFVTAETSQTVTAPATQPVAEPVDETEFDFDDDPVATSPIHEEEVAPEIEISDEDTSFDLDDDDSFFADIDGID